MEQKTLATCRGHEFSASSHGCRLLTHHFTVKGVDSGVSIFWKLFIKGLHEPFQVFLASVLHVLLRVRRRKVKVAGLEGKARRRP